MQYSRYPWFGVSTYATFADFPSIAGDGEAAIALDTDSFYLFDGATQTWVLIGTGGGGTVNSVNAGVQISITGPATDPIVNWLGGITDATMTGSGLPSNPFSVVGLDTNFVLTVRLATLVPLPGLWIYNNGVAGVGATYTRTTNGPLASIDGVTPVTNDDILIKNELNQIFNGIYTFTQGTIVTPVSFVRRTDSDETSEFDGQIVKSSEGSQRVLIFSQQTPDPIVGTNNIVYTSTNALYHVQIRVRNQGVNVGALGTWNVLDFVGPGVSVSTLGNKRTVTIPGGLSNITIGVTPILLSTPGSVLFVGSSNEIQEDNANFFYNNTTNRLGIQKNNPLFAIDSAGTINSDVQYNILGDFFATQDPINGSLRIGLGSIAGLGSQAFGFNAVASGDSSFAFGAGASATGLQSIAMGTNTIANAIASYALGHSASATGQESLAIGQSASSVGLRSVAIGNVAGANGDNSIALGQAFTSALFAIAIGDGAVSTFINSIAFGKGANTSDINQFVVGGTGLEAIPNWKINTIDYIMPAAQGGVGTFLGNDGAGNLAWATPAGGPGITLGPVGSAPNTDAATLTGTVLNLEPANATFPGVVSINTQSFKGIKEFIDRTVFSNGTAVGPSIAFTSELSKGFFHNGVGSIGISVLGAIKYEINNTVLQSTDLRSFLLNRVAGSALVPTYSFNDDPDTGMYSDVAGFIRWANDGSPNMTLNPSGKLGIGSGVTSPTARLHLQGGSAAAGNAPFKFNSGTNLTTPENGSFEYNGTDLFFTKSGAVRGTAYIQTPRSHTLQVLAVNTPRTPNAVHDVQVVITFNQVSTDGQTATGNVQVDNSGGGVFTTIGTALQLANVTGVGVTITLTQEKVVTVTVPMGSQYQWTTAGTGTTTVISIYELIL